MNRPSNIHLFIIWQSASYCLRRICTDIQARFDILRVYKMIWSPHRFSSNLSRFYGEKLPTGSDKERHCGRGPFTMVVVRDPNPVYKERRTSAGTSIVNINIFDAKERYRSWTGGGHRIHASNTSQETDHDLTLLLGFNTQDYIDQNSTEWDGSTITLEQDVVGFDGWETAEQFFYVLNSTLRYVVLRNFEALPHSLYSERHGDIDLLTDSYTDIQLIANAKPLFNQPLRVHNVVSIAGKSVLFDFRYVGDGYYDHKWEEKILRTRRLGDTGFYVPNKENHFYSLLYHALIHKRQIADDYIPMLYHLANQAGVLVSGTKEAPDLQALRECLLRYLKIRGYDITLPSDLSVYYNPLRTLGPVKVKRALKHVFWVSKSFASHYYKKCTDYSVRAARWMWRRKNRPADIGYLIYWYASHIGKFRRQLETKFGIQIIRSIYPLSWHWGCAYFEGATPDGERLFIKTSGWMNLAPHEAMFMSLLNKTKCSIRDSVPELRSFGTAGDTTFLAMDYVSGRTLEDILNGSQQISLNAKGALIRELVALVQGLREQRIVHRDIHPSNLLVNGDISVGDIHLVLLDFAFAVRRVESGWQTPPMNDKNRDVLIHLGRSLNPSPLVWDDAYSCFRVAEMIDPNFYVHFPEQWHILAAMVGSLFYTDRNIDGGRL